MSQDQTSGAAYWLSLAASPTFALMALQTVCFSDGRTDLLCSAADASPLAGMVPMYLLMAAFHATPWWRLISRRCSRLEPPPGGEREGPALKAWEGEGFRLVQFRTSALPARRPTP